MMQLLTQGLIEKLPKLYATEEIPVAEKIAIAKFFHPASNWTWYVIEFDGEDLCWGLVDGHDVEFGYFSLSEISEERGPFGLRIERDRHFKPTRVKDLAAYGKGGAAY